jgi:ABC-type transport system involved in cytochrome c biogenesis permease component
MFCSSISRDERRAMVVAFLIVLCFAGGFPFLAGICYEWHPARTFYHYVFIPSPGYAAFMAFDYPFTKMPFNHFYPSVIFTHVLSWVLLVAASLIVPRTWQDKALTADQVRRREKLNRLQLGTSEIRRNFRHRLLALNPFYWLAARHRTKPFAVWTLLGAIAFVWTLGLIFNPHDWKDDAAYIWTAVIVHTVLKFWVVTEACRRFSLDRQSGALELLLSTPITVKEIVRGQWMALERQFAGPVFVVLVADFVFLLAGRRESELVMMWVGGMIIFVTDLLALSWLGMWRGLNSRRPNRAAAAALVRVLVLPWMVFLMLLTLAALTNTFGRRSSGWEGHSVVLLWTAIGLCFNVIFGIPARRRLLGDFRQVATQRFEARDSKRE